MTENTSPTTPCDPGKIQDHFDLFQTQTYRDLFEYKRQFEGAHSHDAVAEAAEWTKSWEYREKNFAREALTINPAKAHAGLMISLVFLRNMMPSNRKQSRRYFE